MFSQAVVHDPTAKTTGKLAPRGVLMIFVGYEPGVKGWRFYNPETKRRIISRDAVFLEHCDGGELLRGETPADFMDDLEILLPRSGVRDDTDQHDDADGYDEEEFDVCFGQGHSSSTPARDADTTNDGVNADPAVVNIEADDGADSPSDDGGVGLDLGWDELDSECIDDLSLHEAHAECTLDGVEKEGVCAEHACFGEVPQSYREAERSADAAKWKSAIAEELANHEKYSTWVIKPRAEAQGKILTNGWTFVTKLNQEGTGIRYKARLFVRGCQQTPAQYTEVSAPVTNLMMLRLLLHRAVTVGSTVVKHIDIKAAYLQADLKEKIYMEVPEGLSGVNHKQFVCELRKSLYGLRQAGFNWNTDLHEFLTAAGLTRSEIDPALYHLKGRDAPVITVYVDDLIVMTSSVEEMRAFIERMREKYTIKVTDLTVYLSQRVTWSTDADTSGNAGGVSVDQVAYIDKVLRDYGLHEANGSRNPNMRVRPKDSTPGEASAFRKAVGQLLWIQRTARPDITFPMMQLCTAVGDPTAEDAARLKKVMRYLNATRDYGLLIQPGGELIAFVDSDWATDETDRRSVSGFVIGFQSESGDFSPIVWRSKKQTCVATSTCEAEYVAMHEVCREVTFLRSVLKEIGWSKGRKPTVVFCDNRSAVAIGNDEAVRSKRARYIDIRFHYARWCARQGLVRFQWIGTKENIADLFTKSVSNDVFAKHARRLAKPLGWPKT